MRRPSRQGLLPYCPWYFDFRVTANANPLPGKELRVLYIPSPLTIFNQLNTITSPSGVGAYLPPPEANSAQACRALKAKNIMKAFSKLSLLLALSLSVFFPSNAQQWKERIAHAFEIIKAEGRSDIPELTVPTEDGITVLEFVKVFLSDSSHSVRMTACKLIFEAASGSRVNNVRQHGVNILTHTCIDNNSEVVGNVIRYLSKFQNGDFSDSAKSNVRRLVSDKINFRKELIKLAGFLRLEDLIPLIRSYSLPDHSPAIRWAALLSLSRMGDDKAVSEVLRRVKRLPVNDDVVYSIFPDLIFTRRPEAVGYLIDILHRDTKDCNGANAEKEIAIPCGYRVMEQLASVIEGYPLKLDEAGDVIANDYPAALETARKWFLNNKDFKIIDDRY